MASGEDNATDGPRQRKLTEKGLEYQREVTEQKRKQIIRNLDRILGDLNELLTESKDKQIVKDCFSKWLCSYEDLLEVNETYLNLVHPDEVKEVELFLERANQKYNDLKRMTEHWFLSTPNPTEERQMPTKTNSVCSFASKSTSSHISEARIKEAQRQAEIQARLLALKEKQSLEQSKLKLRMEEESLQLNTELRVSDARAKAIDELERSMAQDETDLKILDHQKGKNTCQDKVQDNKTYLAETVTPQRPNKELEIQRVKPTTDNLMLNITKELNKPKSDIIKFTGSVMEYTRFMRQFQTRIVHNTDSYEEKLNYLLQFTGGEAHKIVLGYSNLDAEVGFNAAIDEFEERYGDPEIIAQAYVKRVLNWPAIKSDQALDEFSIFLRECEFAVQNIKSMQILEYAENLKLIITKWAFPKKWFTSLFPYNSPE